MSDASAEERARPTQEALAISTSDQHDVLKLYEAIRKGKAKLVGPDGEARVLPTSLYSFLVELIGLLNEGKCVSIIQTQAQLTTVEAASILGVSRQFLVNLLDRGDIPHHLVGTHRRIYAHDLMSYKAKRDQRRRSKLSELVRAEVAEGLYDRTLLPEEGNEAQ